MSVPRVSVRTSWCISARTFALMKIRSSSFSRRTTASRRTPATLLGHTRIAGTLPRSSRRPWCRAHRRPSKHQAPQLRLPALTQRQSPEGWSPPPTQRMACGRTERPPRTTCCPAKRRQKHSSSLLCSCETSLHTRLWHTGRNEGTSSFAAGSHTVLVMRTVAGKKTIIEVA